MDIAVVLSPFEDFHRLIIGDIVSSSCFAAVVGHISHSYTPVMVVVGTTFVKFLAAVAAGADGCPDMAFILFQPI